jgi:hypothetical protein
LVKLVIVIEIKFIKNKSKQTTNIQHFKNSRF